MHTHVFVKNSCRLFSPPEFVNSCSRVKHWTSARGPEPVIWSRYFTIAIAIIQKQAFIKERFVIGIQCTRIQFDHVSLIKVKNDQKWRISVRRNFRKMNSKFS